MKLDDTNSYNEISQIDFILEARLESNLYRQRAINEEEPREMRVSTDWRVKHV